MHSDTDALVVGAGPAGSAIAILLATAGWRVTIAEQHSFPRRKVCGECIAAGNLSVFDQLGVGGEFRDMAGAELRQVAWMGAGSTTIAELPPCETGPYPYGRALSRDRLDALLLDRARAVGVAVLQPAKVRRIQGSLGMFDADIDCGRARSLHVVRASIIIDASGSWETGAGTSRVAALPGDLFAFKATYSDGSLAPGILPVFSLDGGYGGIVTADRGRTTLACCIRRDTLQALRQRAPLRTAGSAVESYLWRSCHGIRDALRSAHLEGPWLAAGPIRPGIRVRAEQGRFRVGNAAGEAHPLIGEGISMALQSSLLLAQHLTQQPPALIDAICADQLQRAYVDAWQQAFSGRLRMARTFAHLAMRPLIAAPIGVVLGRWPYLLTHAARIAGKARHAVVSFQTSAEAT